MQTAANILQASFTNAITINMEVGYGEWANQDFGLVLGAEGGPLVTQSVSYSSLRSLLASHATSPEIVQAVNALPNTNSLQGVSSFDIAAAQEKALGLLPATASALDGAVGLGTQIVGSEFVAVALHEITHAMGRVVGGTSLDLFRYSSPGQHVFTPAIPAPPAYLSLDGGNTDAADFGQSSDPSDFLNGGAQDSGLNGASDPFDEFYDNTSLTGLTPVDLAAMGLLGFNSPPSGPPAVTEQLVNNTGGSAALITSNPAVTGGGDPNATVTITEGGATRGTTSADSSGHWTFTPSLPDGTHTLVASETNAAGTGSASLTFTLDTSVPATIAVSLIVAANSGPTAIGIASPSDTNDAASALTITVSALPSNGTVLLSDGVTGVLTGESLTLSQLSGLEFRPTAGLVGASSSFGYTVSDPAANTSSGSATLAIGRQISRNDFDADGTSDVLLHNDSGSFVEWGMRGASITAAQNLSYQGNAISVDGSWAVAGTGDFSGDGKADILLHSSSGTFVDWTMNGAAVTAAQNLTYQGNPVALDASWSVAGAGDFDGNGNSDILLHGTNGAFVLWTMNGGAITAAQNVMFNGAAVSLDASWSSAAVGDFNGDGRADILLRNTNGSFVDWTMDGASITGAQTLTSQGNQVRLDGSWSVLGAGDFNGDGRADALLRGSDGSFVDWTMNGSTIADASDLVFQGAPVNVDASWTFADLGDYNADAKSDILLRSSSGSLADWTMSGATITAGQYLTFQGAAVSLDNTWHVAA